MQDYLGSNSILIMQITSKICVEYLFLRIPLQIQISVHVLLRSERGTGNGTSQQGPHQRLFVLLCCMINYRDFYRC